MAATPLYDTDFYAWTKDQANLLRHAKFEQLDIANLIEEIEDMGKSQRRELESRLMVLIAHLLKWQYQPDHRSRSWEATIQIQRSSLQRLLRNNPSLRTRIKVAINAIYRDAVLSAWGETGLERTIFPIDCPYPAAQILDSAFFPEP